MASRTAVDRCSRSCSVVRGREERRGHRRERRPVLVGERQGPRRRAVGGLGHSQGADAWSVNRAAMPEASAAAEAAPSAATDPPPGIGVRPESRSRKSAMVSCAVSVAMG